MNDIKVLQCCDSCKWGEGSYEGEVECRCPTALTRAKEIKEYNDSESSVDVKEIDWIYDCNGKVVDDPCFYTLRYISSWGSHQCGYWEGVE